MTIESSLAEIRARVEAATDGPWEWEGESDEEWPQGENSLIGRRGTNGLVLCAWGYDAYGITVDEADAEFIAASRTDLPALLAAVEAVRELADRLEWEADPANHLGEDLDYCRIATAQRIRAALTTALDADTTTREDQTHD